MTECMSGRGMTMGIIMGFMMAGKMGMVMGIAIYMEILVGMMLRITMICMAGMRMEMMDVGMMDMGMGVTVESMSFAGMADMVGASIGITRHIFRSARVFQWQGVRSQQLPTPK
jgi:hypothetical protein